MVPLNDLLKGWDELGLLKGKRRQRTNSTHVIVAVRALKLLGLGEESVRRMLDEAAQLAPDWLREHMKSEWPKRYGRRFDSYRLPIRKAERDVLAIEIREDGYYLLQFFVFFDQTD